MVFAIIILYIVSQGLRASADLVPEQIAVSLYNCFSAV